MARPLAAALTPTTTNNVDYEDDDDDSDDDGNDDKAVHLQLRAQCRCNSQVNTIPDGGHQCIELVVRLFKEPSSWIKHLHVQWIPNLNKFFARYANQAWHTCEPVCPDLTNFDHIGQAPRVILEFFNNLNILWHIGRWPNIENNLAIWSRLWIFFQFLVCHFRHCSWHKPDED